MEPIERITQLGILPVISIKKLEQALPLAKALSDGGIPAIEITLRTECGLASIRKISHEFPHMTVGAGTVLTCEQADEAIAAGASYIVTPGFSEKIVIYCIDHQYPVIPGCATGAEITRAVELGLTTLKFFPAEPSGGLAALKLISGPFSGIRFIPTGGMTMDNIGSYLANDFIAACGGSFMATSDDIEQGKFELITEKCRKCMDISLGFELAHVGINNGSQEDAVKEAQRLAALFRLPIRVGHSSTFVAHSVEFMHMQYFGEKGHIGFFTNSVARALAYYHSQGIRVREDSIKKDMSGKLVSFYIQDEICGFAIHVVCR